MKKLIVAALVAFLAMPVMAGDNKGLQQLEGELVKVLGTKPDAIKEAPIKGFYEVSYGTKLYYVSLDGRYLFNGELYDLKSKSNLTEQNRAAARLKVLKTIDESSLIVYKAKGKEKHVATVFTDVDCGYCRKLHSGMQEMNELGITIRYMAFPRAGIGSSSYNKAVSVWCAKDRNKAMDAAKRGEMPEEATCDSPVKKHYETGLALGVSGTPAIFLQDGTLMPGYLPPQQLLQAMNDSGHQ